MKKLIYKKRILLIQPENREINQFRKKQFNNFVQITIPYLAAYIDEEKYHITIIDEYNTKIPYHKEYDLVAITVNTPNASHCYYISSIFRNNGAKVVMGGPHATILPEEVELHCDYLIIGESENTWPQFLSDFYEKKPKKRYIENSPPHLKGLPLPRWDLLKHRSFVMKGAVFATRGCPYNCNYCNLKQIYHNSFRKRPISEVIKEIKAIRSKYFVFWDDNFFADKEYAKKLLKRLAPLKKKWAAQVTIADCADDSLLQAAREAGCLYLFLGLESFSANSLKEAGKQINRLKDYQIIIDKIHKHNIMIQSGIVFGFDNDTASVFIDTLRACEQLGIDGVTVSILIPFPKTPIYEQMKRENRLITHDWSRYNGKTSVAFKPKNMTPQELYDGYLSFCNNFYSPSSFIKRMRKSKTHLIYNLIINLGYKLSINQKLKNRSVL